MSSNKGGVASAAPFFYVQVRYIIYNTSCIDLKYFRLSILEAKLAVYKSVYSDKKHLTEVYMRDIILNKINYQ